MRIRSAMGTSIRRGQPRMDVPAGSWKSLIRPRIDSLGGHDGVSLAADRVESRLLDRTLRGQFRRLLRSFDGSTETDLRTVEVVLGQGDPAEDPISLADRRKNLGVGIRLAEGGPQEVEGLVD